MAEPTAGELEDGCIDAARAGDEAAIAEAIEAGADVNATTWGGKTALHMACANGHAGCTRRLLEAGAKHVGNESGNTPLHWAVLNVALEVVEVLCQAAPDLDVLAKNSFGKSALGDAVGLGEKGTPITKLLLEHKSADKLEETTGGNVAVEDDDGTAGGDAAAPAAAPPTAAPAASAAESTVVQSHTHVFDFAGSGVELHAREVATDWEGAVFGARAAATEDTTGMHVWATALVAARWITELQADPATAFAAKRVIELGAGAGVPGLAALLYSGAAKVTLTDVFKHTLTNLRFNVALNLKASGAAAGRSYADVEVRELDWHTRAPEMAGAFDVVLGSDLVYDDELVPPLLQLIDHVLAPGGTFLMVAAAGRQGVATLVDALRQTRFAVTATPAADRLRANPLVSGDAAALELHFSELHSAEYTLYTVTRGDAAGR